MPPRRYGVFTPCAVFVDPTGDAAHRGKCGQYRKGGGKSENNRIANSVEFWLPCGPEYFGAAGRGWQLRASVTASGLECKRGRLGGTWHAPGCQSVYQVFHKSNFRRGHLNPQPLIDRPSANASAPSQHARSQWSGLWPAARAARGCLDSEAFRLPSGRTRLRRDEGQPSWHSWNEIRRECS